MGTGEKRILIVEDDESIRALLVTLLRRRGFQLDTARDGAEALERVTCCHYAVLLLDIMMPRMSGQEVLAELAKLPESKRPVVIVLTAGAEPRNLDPSLVAGTLRKPFDIELLVNTVTACLSAMSDRPQLDSCPPAESDRYSEARDPPYKTN